MIVQCPQCPARLNVPEERPDDAPVQCPRCRTVFDPPVVVHEEPIEGAAGDRSWDDDTEPTPRAEARRGPAQPGKKFPYLLVGGVLAGAVAVVVGVVLAMSGGSKPTVANNSPPPTPAPPKKDTTPKREGPRQPPPAQKPQIPAEFAELFVETAAARPAPTVQVPTLQKVGAEALTVPGFAPPAPPAEGDGKMTLDEIKMAATYMKVTAGNVAGTGSGFVIRSEPEELLVATNYHVIQPRSANPLDGPPVVNVVFESGTPGEWQRPGEVIAVDSEIDLAIVRVRKPLRTPKPIDPRFAAKPVELLAIRIYGFPFGATLAVAGRNPNITINIGSLSGISLDAAGNPTELRVNGSLNPGNSGGPILDEQGRLVGIAVKTIQGSGIGIAIPAHELSTLLTGRVSAPVVLPVGLDGGQATFKLLAPIVDPLKMVTGISLHVWSGDNPPEVEKDPAGGWKQLPDSTKVDLTLSAKAATGDFRVPAPNAGRAPTTLLQLECRNSAGATVFSKPIGHRLVTNGVQTAADALPMETFRRDLAKYAGQVVVVRGKVAAGTPKRGAVFEVPITDESDATPEGLVFVANRDVATQLNELPPEALTLPARLTLQVAKAANGGVTAARVTQVDFIGRGNLLKQTIPSTTEPTDPLVALNRAPEKYVGQTLQVPAYVSPAVLGRDDAPELTILLRSEKRPDNLHFTSSPQLAAKLKEPSMQGYLFAAIVTVKVESRQFDGYGPQIVTVQKIELADRDGRRRTIE